MRKEIVLNLRGSNKRKVIFFTMLFIFLFIIVNGFFVYSFGGDGYYLRLVKKVIPYPAIIIGKHYITFSEYDDEVYLNKKLYSIAYRVDFDESNEGRANLQQLRKNVVQDIINRNIMVDLLSSIDREVDKKEIKDEYQNILKDVGSDKEINNILKYSSNVTERDIQEKIFYNILKDKVSQNFIYNAKLKVISIKPVDANKQEDWDGAQKKAQEIRNSIQEKPSVFDRYYIMESDKNDPVAQNFGRDHYFKEDLPSQLTEAFFRLNKGEISDVIKADAGYYILKLEDSRGYHRGSFDEFMNEQRGMFRMYSFVR